jgi:hypothetical protein
MAQAYMLNTKVGRYEQQVDKMFDFTAERMTRSVDESLERLGLEYIDCIQVSDPKQPRSPSKRILILLVCACNQDCIYSTAEGTHEHMCDGHTPFFPHVDSAASCNPLHVVEGLPISPSHTCVDLRIHAHAPCHAG